MIAEVPSGHIVKETLDFFHNLPNKEPISYIVKETLDLFHNLLSKVPSGHIVKVATGFFQKIPTYLTTMYPVGFFQRTHKELTIYSNFTTNSQRTH